MFSQGSIGGLVLWIEIVGIHPSDYLGESQESQKKQTTT